MGIKKTSWHTHTSLIPHRPLLSVSCMSLHELARAKRFAAGSFFVPLELFILDHLNPRRRKPAATVPACPRAVRASCDLAFVVQARASSRAVVQETCAPDLCKSLGQVGVLDCKTPLQGRLQTVPTKVCRGQVPTTYY